MILLTGCATKYQSLGLTGGFEDLELSPGYYRVNFWGNGVTSGERVRDLALLRAAELASKNKCRSFQVMNGRNAVSSTLVSLPKTQTTNTNAHIYGNYITGQSTTTTYGGGVQSINRANTSIDVRCVNQEADPSIDIYDTDFLKQKLKEKYKIK